jgi:hypothetical protein
MSFWSTLSGGLASLIPGVGPFIGPLVGAGVAGLTGGLLGKGSGSATSGGDTTASLNGQLGQVLGGGSPTPQAQQASKYYSTILNGNRTATEALLRPQVSTVLGQYDNAAKAAAELGPRGGGRTETQAELGSKKVGVYENALETAQPKAAEGLTTLSGQNNGLISSLLGARTGSNQLGFEQTQETNKQLGGLGSGIGSILVNLLKGKGKGAGASPGGGGILGTGSFGDAGDE